MQGLIRAIVHPRELLLVMVMMTVIDNLLGGLGIRRIALDFYVRRQLCVLDLHVLTLLVLLMLLVTDGRRGPQVHLSARLLLARGRLLARVGVNKQAAIIGEL